MLDVLETRAAMDPRNFSGFAGGFACITLDEKAIDTQGIYGVSGGGELLFLSPVGSLGEAASLNDEEAAKSKSVRHTQGYSAKKTESDAILPLPPLLRTCHIFAITASRQQASPEENAAANQALRADIAGLGEGYGLDLRYGAVGIWNSFLCGFIDDEGKPEWRVDGLCVAYFPCYAEGGRQKLIAFAKKYEQDLFFEYIPQTMTGMGDPGRLVRKVVIAGGEGSQLDSDGVVYVRTSPSKDFVDNRPKVSAHAKPAFSPEHNKNKDEDHKASLHAQESGSKETDDGAARGGGYTELAGDKYGFFSDAEDDADSDVEADKGTAVNSRSAQPVEPVVRVQQPAERGEVAWSAEGIDVDIQTVLEKGAKAYLLLVMDDEILGKIDGAETSSMTLAVPCEDGTHHLQVYLVREDATPQDVRATGFGVLSSAKTSFTVHGGPFAPE